MRWTETLYRRNLRRPLDSPTREAINQTFSRRRHEIPIPCELSWHKTQPQFTLSSQWLSFHVKFQPDQMVVDAELTLAAKMMATQEHRREAIQFIESIATELGL